MSDIPQWLVSIFARAESCALDNPADRERLAMLVMDGLPLQRMAELAAETVKHQLAQRNIRIDHATALDVARNALQAMLGELHRLPGES